MPVQHRRRLLYLVLATLLLFASVLLAQVPRRQIYSRPEIPTDEVLRRLNLRLGWRGYVPMDGGRDALIHIEMEGKDLFALTRSGTVQRMDAETGKVHWRSSVGKPYTILPYIAANSRSVYVTANAKMVGLDRITGIRKWEYDLPGGVSSAPVVDEEQIYVPTASTRLYAYYLPSVTTTEAEAPGETIRRSSVYGEEKDDQGPRPHLAWVDQTNLQLVYRPLQAADSIFVISPSGKALGFSKTTAAGVPTAQLFAFSTEGRIRVAPASYGATAYIGSDDAALYAVNVTTGRLRWRHTAGTAITRPPAATAKDVFITSDREGLARIDRASGDAVWRIPQGRTLLSANVMADRFLAANEHFVYATDHSGRLLILDRKRGVRLSTLDTRAFRIPVVNEVTDRLYLAANDGLIVCLHDRDVVTPIRHRKALEEANSPLVKILNQTIEEPSVKEMPLRDILADLRKKYKIRIDIAERAFKDAGITDLEDRKIKPPVTVARPLRDHLQRLLKPINALFKILDDRILIVPGPGKPVE